MATTVTTKPNKAVAAAILAALAAVIATITGEGDSFNSINDWIVCVLSAVVAGIVVYQVPNPPTGT